MNKREKGSRYEEIAASFCIAKGYRLLEKNYRRKTGEIDLILQDGRTVVFTEVKFRSRTRNGFPEEAVNSAKQQRIYRTAEWYLNEMHLPPDTPCRFDVISILDSRVEHIENAFGGF